MLRRKLRDDADDTSPRTNQESEAAFATFFRDTLKISCAAHQN